MRSLCIASRESSLLVPTRESTRSNEDPALQKINNFFLKSIYLSCWFIIILGYPSTQNEVTDKSRIPEDRRASYLLFPSRFSLPPSLFFWRETYPFGHRGGLRPSWHNGVLPGAWTMTLKRTCSLFWGVVVNLRLPMASFPATWTEYMGRSPSRD